MALPSGWIANIPAAETIVPSYTGDQIKGVVPVPGQNKGRQPKSVNNPNGDYAGVPVMAINSGNAAALDSGG